MLAVHMLAVCAKKVEGECVSNNGSSQKVIGGHRCRKVFCVKKKRRVGADEFVVSD
jgi:hypothetical protein